MDMRESIHNNEPVDPSDMDEFMESNTWSFENTNFDDILDQEVSPYITDKSEDGVYTTMFIAQLLALPDEKIIETLARQDIESSVMIDQYYTAIKKAFEDNIILKTAPWYKALEDKIMSFELFKAGLVDDEVVEKNRLDFVKEVQRKLSK